MNDQRISLTRVLAVNWYGFRQILDVSNDTLLSGAFGTGKSALLDLIQYVLLGENWRPNRAAAGNARGRSLVSYCLCDTNTTREGEPHYTRASGVTLAALEFSWPADARSQKRRRETWGMRIEFSSPTSEPKRTYFVVPDRLEWSEIAPEGQMMDEEQFRTWIRREHGHDCLFPRQKDYLAEMATPRHLYFDRDQLDKTMPKAIAFEPEENVCKFIREFILEDSPVDVKDVQIAVSAYRETQARLENQEDEAAHLRQIEAHHRAWEEARRESALWSHTGFALLHAQALERRDRHQEQLDRLKAQFADDVAALKRGQTELETVQKLIADIRLQVSRDPEQVKLEALRRSEKSLKEQIGQLQEAARSIRSQLDARYQRWSQWLKHGTALPLAELGRLLQGHDAELSALQRGPDTDRLGAMARLAARFGGIFVDARALLQPHQEELKNADARIQALTRELELLEQQRMPGSFPLFEALQAGMPGRAEQLGRLVEVRASEERWWPVLESVLASHRWSILVEDRDYRPALEVLQKTAPGRESESLVNPRDLAEAVPQSAVPAPLASKVETAHEGARQLTALLLGDIECVESAADLEKSKSRRAVTSSGLFKDGPLRKRVRAGSDVPLTLGREGLARMKRLRERELIEARTHRDQLDQRIRDAMAWLDSGYKSGLGDAQIPDRSAELNQLPGLEKELAVTAETLKFLSTPESEARLKKLEDQERRRSELDGRLAVLASNNQAFELKSRAEEEALESARRDLQSAEISLQESRVRLGSGFLESELATRLESVRAEFSKWNERLIAVQNRAHDAELEASARRNDRDTARRLLIANERHPEYRHDFSPDDDSNDSWSARLRLLEETELPKFRALAAERRRDWEKRLQEQVLDRLNENIRNAERTVKQLREYLDRRIGRYRYRISQKRDAAFSGIWRLLDSGLEPSDPLMQGIQNEEARRARDELMAAVESNGADERAARLLDYRYYHQYDLEMVLADRPDAPPISLSRSGRNLSGGENQAPFFISMLAAFHRVYDLGGSRSNHLGLVVMDEAFSKLSGDGVEDCLDLARNFQLQLVMAFPIDRLGVMAPYADTVIVCRKEEERDAEGYVTRVDNIPILLTPEQVQESLA